MHLSKPAEVARVAATIPVSYVISTCCGWPHRTTQHLDRTGDNPCTRDRRHNGGRPVHPRTRNAADTGRGHASAGSSISADRSPTAEAASPAEDAELTVPSAQAHDLGTVPAVNIVPSGPTKARRQETWAAVAETTTTAVHRAETLVDCAISAAGYRSATEDELPEGLRTVAHAITYAATGIAWRAIRTLTEQGTWSWEAGTGAASTAATTVHSAFRPTELKVREGMSGPDPQG